MMMMMMMNSSQWEGEEGEKELCVLYFKSMIMNF